MKPITRNTLFYGDTLAMLRAVWLRGNAARDSKKDAASYYFIYRSHVQDEIYEYETDNEPPKVGDYFDLPLGPDKKLGRYRVMRVAYLLEEQKRTVYDIDVTPA